jgi:hypothetical protein
MRNVTVCIPDQIHRRARVLASQNGVSLSYLVAAVLNSIPGMHRVEDRIAFLQHLSETRGNTASDPSQPQADLPLRDAKIHFIPVTLSND